MCILDEQGHLFIHLLPEIRTFQTIFDGRTGRILECKCLLKISTVLRFAATLRFTLWLYHSQEILRGERCFGSQHK